MRKAIEELFTRDYRDKTQIFVPEYFLAETPYDWKTFCDTSKKNLVLSYLSNIFLDIL